MKSAQATTLRVLVLGNQGVGKSRLVQNLLKIYASVSPATASGGESSAGAEKLVKALPLLSVSKRKLRNDHELHEASEPPDGEKHTSPVLIHKDASGTTKREFDVWNLNLGDGSSVELFDFSKTVS